MNAVNKPDYNIIEPVGKGYSLVWKERSYLWRLAMIPLCIKFICWSILLSLGWQHNFFRHAMVLLPSYFADGWMAAHLVRLVFLGQRWPFRFSGDAEQDKITIFNRASGIIRGTIFYSTIQYFIAGLSALMLLALPAPEIMAEMAENNEMPPGMFFTSIAMLIFCIWGFRLCWCFIPVAVNIPAGLFLRRIPKFSYSLPMIGVWAICTLPALLLFKILIGDAALIEQSVTEMIILRIIRTLIDTVVILLATASMTYWIKALLQKQ